MPPPEVLEAQGLGGWQAPLWARIIGARSATAKRDASVVFTRLRSVLLGRRAGRLTAVHDTVDLVRLNQRFGLVYTTCIATEPVASCSSAGRGRSTQHRDPLAPDRRGRRRGTATFPHRAFLDVGNRPIVTACMATLAGQRPDGVPRVGVRELPAVRELPP